MGEEKTKDYKHGVSFFCAISTMPECSRKGNTLAYGAFWHMREYKGPLWYMRD